MLRSLPVQDISIEENEQYILQLELTDVDTGEVLALSASSLMILQFANSNDSTVTLTPAADWYGESEVVVAVSDGELSDTTNFMVIIEPINDAPRLSEILDQPCMKMIHLQFSRSGKCRYR